MILLFSSLLFSSLSLFFERAAQILLCVTLVHLGAQSVCLVRCTCTHLHIHTRILSPFSPHYTTLHYITPRSAATHRGGRAAKENKGGGGGFVRGGWILACLLGWMVSYVCMYVCNVCREVGRERTKSKPYRASQPSQPVSQQARFPPFLPRCLAFAAAAATALNPLNLARARIPR